MVVNLEKGKLHKHKKDKIKHSKIWKKGNHPTFGWQKVGELAHLA